MRFEIRPARPEDIGRLIELLGELFATEADFAADGARQRRGLEMLLAEAARGDRAAVAVAHDARGTAVAMASAQLVISTAEGALSAWLEDVVVHRDHRRQGLARQMLHYLLDWARERGATRVQLVADLHNAPAQLVYDRLGWSTTQLIVRRRVID